MDKCVSKAAVDQILGALLCVAGACTYVPQYISLIKSKQSKGISELSLFVLNIGTVALLLNVIILNWSRFACYYSCDFWVCTAYLLPLIQIGVGWLMVLPLYIIFLRFKIGSKRLAFREDPEQKHWLWYFGYAVTYFLFTLIVMMISVIEEWTRTPVESAKFFAIFGRILGVTSAITSCIVWIPQIVKLIQTKNQGSLSLVMFILQTPGSIVIIIFQAVLFEQNWSTWISYVVLFVQQLTIVIILIVYKCRARNQMIEIDHPTYDPIYEVPPGSTTGMENVLEKVELLSDPELKEGEVSF